MTDNTRIDEKIVKQLAEMAAIELSPEELALLRLDLEQCADFVAEHFAGMDTEGLGEMVRPFDEHNEHNGDGSFCVHRCPMRDDIVTNGDMTEEMLAGAPDRKGPYIRTPRTVEE